MTVKWGLMGPLFSERVSEGTKRFRSSTSHKIGLKIRAYFTYLKES